MECSETTNKQSETSPRPRWLVFVGGPLDGQSLLTDAMPEPFMLFGKARSQWFVYHYARECSDFDPFPMPYDRYAYRGQLSIANWPDDRRQELYALPKSMQTEGIE